MAKKKTSYSELCDAISEKVKQNGISSFSRTDLVSMAHSMVNCPEHEVEIIVKGKDGAAPEKVTTTPVKRYRNSLRPVLNAFGIDKNEQDRILDVPFTREHAEAITDVALNLTKDFIGTGRKLLLPMTSTTESQMAISEVNVPVKTSEPRKIVKEPDGSYSSVPTGKKVTTAAHSAVKASNKIPYWLKKSK